MNSERHPLEPFLPENARLLMLGSFPPKRIRWSMEFFYPNLQNDMWRIVGYLPVEDIEIGRHLNADVRGRMIELEIVPMPFYKLDK